MCRDDPELLRQLNDALRQAIRGGKDGPLGRIYTKYGLWNDDQEQLAALAAGPWPPQGEGDALPSRWARLPYFVPTLLQAGLKQGKTAEQADSRS